MAKRRDYGYVRSYASLGSDLDDIQNFINAGYAGALLNYDDPQLDKAVRDLQRAGISFGIWGDPNAVGDNNAAYVARMQRLNQMYRPDLFALDLENSYKGDPGSANWNKMGELARMWQQAMPGVRTAITPLGSTHSMNNWNVGAWGDQTEWMPQAYGADSHKEVYGPADIVRTMIAAGVDPSRISPILADGHYNMGLGGYGGSAMWTIDDWIGKQVPKASGPATQQTATGGSAVPTTSTPSRTTQGKGRSPLSFLGQGFSQAPTRIENKGLQWFGKTFGTQQAFAKELQRRGKTYSAWAAQHQPAAQALKRRSK